MRIIRNAVASYNKAENIIKCTRNAWIWTKTQFIIPINVNIHLIVRPV